MTLIYICNQATCRIAINTLSAPGIVLPTSIIALRISLPVIGGKSIWQVIVIGISDSILPVSTLLVSNSVTSSSLFSSIDFAGGLSKCDGSLSKGLR